LEYYIYGTPTQAGVFSNVLITAHEGSASGSATYTITIAAAPAAHAAAQALDSVDSTTGHPHYKLIDMGTFGGPRSYLNDANAENNGVMILNNRGAVAGTAETAAKDPSCFNEDCFISHAFRWQSGVLTDLGTLVKGRNSQAAWIAPNGLITGIGDNGEIDPLVSGLTQTRAVLWVNGKILDLGTLPEGGYESVGDAVNSKGQVIGWATNTVPDANSMAAPGFLTTQTRAFFWANGKMQDLRTLGNGSDAMAQFINEQGQVVGWSYTGEAGKCILPGPTPVPLTTHSFIWDEEHGMRDLGTLGGTCTIATGINDSGVVVGDNVAALERGFLWKDGNIRDLGGSIGGEQTGAEAINASGEVVGFATLAGEAVFHATLWSRIGEIKDLGALGPGECSFAVSVNSSMQVVGSSSADCAGFSSARGMLWQDGVLYDLNTLIAPGASLVLESGTNINESGEIAGSGMDLISGNEHVFLLIPCDTEKSGYCKEEVAGASVADQASAARGPLPPLLMSARHANRRYSPLLHH
jgi:probable HAF family extracellular repeat protein